MKNRVLIIVTNHDHYEKDNEPTGLWLGELVHFYEPFREAGFTLDIASPNGGNVPLDPRSLNFIFMDKITRQYHDDSQFMDQLKQSLPITEVNAADYDAVYFTGGHGTMFDFPNNETLQRITREIYEQGGVVSAVCHGVSGLLNVQLSDGSYLVGDKQVTGYSWREEQLALVANRVPFNLENELQQRGGDYHKKFLPFRPHVITDGRLITGQNPQSTRAIAEATLKALR